MTAVVLARTYSDAYDAAQLLGLGQSWVYPHVRELLNGLHVTRVVYVRGWAQSDALTADTMQALASRTTEVTPTTAVNLEAAWAPTVTELVLSAPDAPTPPAGPVVEVPLPRLRSRWRWLIGPAVGLSAGVGFYYLAAWIGW